MVEKRSTSFGKIFWSSAWSSESLFHRLEIRQQILRKTGEESVLNLDNPPVLKMGSASVSHCRAVGGFVLSPDKRVGFDLEEKHRINNKILKRISSDEELSLFKNSSYYIWPLKEASFKALKKENTSILDFTIIEVDEKEGVLSAEIKASSGERIKAICFEQEGILFSVCKVV